MPVGRRTRGVDYMILMLLGAVPFCPAWAGDVGVSLSGPKDTTLGEYPGHSGHRFREMEGRMDLGKIAYALRYCACMDPAHAPNASWLEGYIGMPGPSACNWYHSGFLFIRLNGQELGTVPLSSMTVAEQGERGILDMVWHHPVASVRVRFLGLPIHNNLYCEIALEPTQEITSLDLRLTCYPSYFTSWNRREGARRIQTPTTLVKQGEDVWLPAVDNWWAVYYDEIFDPARGEGEGPCGLLLLPNEPDRIRFAPSDYGVLTEVSYPPTTRRIHLSLWDFRSVRNADALASMYSSAASFRDELAALDFTPAAVRGLDTAAIRAQAEAALRSPAASAVLADKIGQIQEWLEQEVPALEARPEATSIEAEERLLMSLTKYYGFIWEIRLAELLGNL